jgi:hypothetical protein
MKVDLPCKSYNELTALVLSMGCCYLDSNNIMHQMVNGKLISKPAKCVKTATGYVHVWIDEM